MVSGIVSGPTTVSNLFLYGRLPACPNSTLVIPTAGRDLIGGAVNLPVSSHEYHLVILEESMPCAVNLLTRKSPPLLYSPTFFLRLPQSDNYRDLPAVGMTTR
jgi:hypothetical protein